MTQFHLTGQKIADRVIVVSVHFPTETQEIFDSSLEELEGLIDTLGGQIVGRTIQKRHSPDPGFFIGSGKVQDIADLVKESEASLVAFDNELSGSQQKKLEEHLRCRVIDRTGIILDIFSRHARSKEAKNQVEVATLQYMSSRLTRMWTHFERQRGGIGLKGLGERQIELDRRMIRERIAKLKKDLKHTEQDRRVQRQHRDKFLRVAIVGYTNAGKSTVMNNLTTAEVLVDDRVFATLDSTVRIIDPKTRPPILLSDTVGFIRKLPHTLVASFRSTLQEVLEADMLLHVVDLSASNYEEQIEVTQAVLDDIGAGDKPALLVFNKADRVRDFLLPKLLVRRYIDSLVVSAKKPEDMKRLREAIYAYFERDMLEMDLVLPYTDTLLTAKIHEYSKVLETKYLDEGTYMRVRIMRTDASRLKLEGYKVSGTPAT